MTPPGGLNRVNACQVFGGERDVERLQVVFELRERTRPDDRARDPGLADRPRERELAHGNALLFGDLLEGVDGFERPGATEESRGPLVRAVREAALGLIALPPVLARQEAAGERTPRDERDAEGLARGDELPLDAPVEQVVRRLLRHEAVEPELFRGP
jgi:hypothetical protein